MSFSQQFSPRLLVAVVLASCPLSALPDGAVGSSRDLDPIGPGLETITVTAQKVPEDLQRTAAAVTAVSGERLLDAGAHDIRAVQNLMPSVRFQAEGASTEIYIRGVGSTLDLPNIEPPTAFNFNGAYVPREGTSVGLFDVERIELLPGPQGTLHGRAALGGTVNVTFNRPSRERESSALLEFGSHALIHGTLVQNVPLGETFALRGAFDYVEHDGYQATGADSRRDYALRVSALYEPVDTLDVHVWLHGARKDGRSPNLVRRGYNGGSFDGDPEAYDHADPWDDRIEPGAPTASPNEYESLGAGAQVDWRTDDWTLTYLPSYFYLDWDGRYWLENIGAQLTAHYNQLTQELRLASAADARLRWLGGLYWYRVANDGDFFTYTNTPQPFPLAQIDQNRLEGHAVFGQATLDVTERLRLVAGGRYSRDQRAGRGRTADGTPYSADRDYDHLDWKLGVEADVAASAMAYAHVQTGYQPGTYNMFPAAEGASNLVAPATMTAWTAGIKTRFLDDRLQLNNEIFYYEYEDLLVQSFNFNTFLLTTFNAARSTIYGNQLDLLYRPNDSGLLNVSVGYLDASYDEFVVPASVDIGLPQRDFGGYPLQYAPEWTVTAGYRHDFAIGPSRLRARIETRYEDEFWGTFAQNRGTRQPGYLKTDASLTWLAPGERWSVGLWVRNLENEPVLAATTTGQFGPYGDAFLEPPRTYGLRFTLAL